MKVNIALCDDDQRALPVIAGAAKSAFSAQGMTAEIQVFSSGDELLKAMEKTLFQLVLLDIEMPGLDGITIGKALRERDDDIGIIYVSEAESRVFESFFIRPLGFVRKSNFLNDISAVIQFYIRERSRNAREDLLDFTTRTGRRALKCRHICYVESSKNYQLLHLDGVNTPVEVKMTMLQLEKMTEPFCFVRVHKGYIVNYQFVQQINTNDLILQDGTKIPIGRSKITEAKIKYINLIEK